MSRSFRFGSAAAVFVASAPLALMAAIPSAAISTIAATSGAVPLSHTLSHHAFLTPPTTADCVAQVGVACYSPAQFQTAYDLGPLYAGGWTGKGKTIAVVDAFGNPKAKANLATFDKAFGLPAPPSFKIIQPVGPVPPFDPNNATMANWAAETNLDVQYAHAMAPGANILLVETPVAETEGVTGFPEIVAAENFVIKHHLADVISQSFGATEQTFPSAQSLLNLRSAFVAAAKANVTVLASSGDDGATDAANAAGSAVFLHRVTSWPASDPLVTGVGGLQYFLDAVGNQTQPAAVWNDTSLLGGLAASGGGRSVIFPRPSYQNSVAAQTGNQRGVPDISLSAAVNGGALVFFSKNILGPGVPAGFYIIGGTSEASPEFAGVVAIADQVAGHDLGLINPALYKLSAAHAAGIVDITAGTNTVTFMQGGTNHTVIGFDARVGYDLSSGVGGIDGAAFVPELVAAD
jgi:subtilase family serine protease